MNVRQYKSVMVLNGDNNKSVAAALNLTPQRVSAKIHGTNGAEFTQSEISTLIDRWHLSPIMTDSIFFQGDGQEGSNV